MRGIGRAGSTWFVGALFACACGWGPDGHRIVATIAEGELSPEARAAVDRILGGQSMAEVCVWADQVRSQDAYRWSAPLHYVNIEPGSPSLDVARDCPNGCAVTAINDEVRLLKDPATPDDKREEALKFLIHFVGDLHQPLHAGRARDRGGNSIQVQAGGVPMNLHAFWDTGAVEAAGKVWTAYAAEIRASITPEQRGAWASLNPADWANESYQLATAVAYPIPADGTLDQAYIDLAKETARIRLAMAGERLAAVLNSIYALEAPAEPTGAAPVERAAQ